MKRITQILIILFLVTASLSFSLPFSHAQTDNDKKELELKAKEEELVKKLEEINNQKNTLSSQISYMNTQISLTTIRIQNTEDQIEKTAEEIENLSGKIERLNSSLDHLSKILLNKIVEGYKRRRLSLLTVLLDSESTSSLYKQMKYIQTSERNDRRIAFHVQQTKFSFEEQKKLREEKKKELDKLQSTLESQNNELAQQKGQKEHLLKVTKNDEQVYQALLAQIRAEYAAIQGIIAGSGTEIKLRDVSKGENIATVIPGISCNSSGEHLHFIVKEKESASTLNPFNYLQQVDHENCSGYSCGSGDGDPFNPSGSWEWPLSPAIKFTQGYGNTWAVHNTWVGRIYQFHNGIDIKGSSNNVRAVADGTLYKGSYAVGCALSYVKLVHADSNLSTLYLHVTPQ